MSGQLQFGGTIPFNDRQRGGQVQMRVWGVYLGQSVDAHEESAIQQWIMNALATSAQQYDGDVYELPQKAVEWGNWVSQRYAQPAKKADPYKKADPQKKADPWKK